MPRDGVDGLFGAVAEVVPHASMEMQVDEARNDVASRRVEHLTVSRRRRSALRVDSREALAFDDDVGGRESRARQNRAAPYLHSAPAAGSTMTVASGWNCRMDAGT